MVPLVQSTAALNDPVPLSEAVRGLFRFLQQVTHAGDAVLLVHHFEPGAERSLAYDRDGNRLEAALVPFSRSIAGSVVSLQESCLMRDLERGGGEAVELQPFERGKRSLLATPLPVAANVQVVVELFDKTGPGGKGPFTAEDQRLLQAAAAFGTDLLRQSLAQRQTNQLLLDAVAAALGATDSVTQSLAQPPGRHPEQPPPRAVLDQLRQGLQETAGATVDAGDSLRLAEAIRVLAVRHGQPTVFQGPAEVRRVYWVILLSHTVLAVVVAPLALFTAYQGWRDRLARHVRIARWTLPIWLYVSLTGVVVYWILYHLYPAP